MSPLSVHLIDGAYELFRQFQGVAVWPMIELEADDALASAARAAAANRKVALPSRCKVACGRSRRARMKKTRGEERIGFERPER